MTGRRVDARKEEKSPKKSKLVVVGSWLQERRKEQEIRGENADRRNGKEGKKSRRESE